MKRVFALGMALVMGAGQVQAQDIIFQPDLVAACFENSETGAASPSCIGYAAEICMETTNNGYTTVGMGTCMAAEIDAWDGFLNTVYQDLRAQMREADAQDYAGDVSRADALRDTQRAWIAYRDAECAFNWAMFQEGTIRSLVAAGCRLDMTAGRALELRDYLETPG